jgi:hypothetical protein
MEVDSPCHVLTIVALMLQTSERLPPLSQWPANLLNCSNVTDTPGRFLNYPEENFRSSNSISDSDHEQMTPHTGL